MKQKKVNGYSHADTLAKALFLGFLSSMLIPVSGDSILTLRSISGAHTLSVAACLTCLLILQRRFNTVETVGAAATYVLLHEWLFMLFYIPFKHGFTLTTKVAMNLATFSLAAPLMLLNPPNMRRLTLLLAAEAIYYMFWVSIGFPISVDVVARDLNQPYVNDDVLTHVVELAEVALYTTLFYHVYGRGASASTHRLKNLLKRLR